MLSGYQIIDFQNTALTAGAASGVEIEGVYDAIEGTRKATLLIGLKVNGIECAPRFVVFTLNGTDFIGKTFIEGGNEYQITVDDDDKVKIAQVMAPIAIVELGGTNLTAGGAAVEIEGTYAPALRGTTGTPTLVSGLKVGGNTLIDRFVEFSEGTATEGEVTTQIVDTEVSYTLTITDDDEVSIATVTD